jgi:hypothetical protein
MKDAAQWRGRFMSLVEGLHRELGEQPPSRLLDDEGLLVMALELDGARFELSHDAGARPDRVVIECFLGPVPEANAATAFVTLLQWNHALRDYAGAGYCADPETGEVMCGVCLSLQHLRPETVLEQMKGIAGKTARWQDAIAQTAVTFEDARRLAAVAGRA